jgi:hypothetical protein
MRVDVISWHKVSIGSVRAYVCSWGCTGNGRATVKLALLTPNRHADRELTIKPFHPAPERMRSPMILAFVRKTMSQKIVVTP